MPHAQREENRRHKRKKQAQRIDPLSSMERVPPPSNGSASSPPPATAARGLRHPPGAEGDGGTPSRGSYDSIPRRADDFANDFVKRESVADIHRQVRGGAQNDHDFEVRVFQEEPRVKVVGGRSEDAWPTRYVEYDVELKYKNFTWQVEIPKSTIYGLWFFVKSKMHGLLNRTNNQSAGSDGSSHAANATWTFPQMRKLFLANAEKSVSPEMVALVQQYLDEVVKEPALLHTAFVSEMFQVSLSTFDDDEGYTSVREGWLRVRMWLKGNQENVRLNRGVVTCDNECFNCMCVIKRVNFMSKKWGWVALKHSSIAVFPSIQDTRASEVLLMDQNYTIERGIQSAGSNTSLVVSNSTYVMQLEAKTKQAIVKWANDIRKAAEKSDWSQSHRDESFAVPRHPSQIASYAKWFVDGKDAFGSMYEALTSARKEIFIAGWWICPSIHLLRPAALFPQSRLDILLQKKAQEGVKVYILMYKEVSVALTLNSNYAKTVFRRLHPNVHVLRDPDFLMKHLGMWSHHEKIVSIDQKVAFLGGLDLCYGRWDTTEHALFDAPHARTNFMGKDYSNPRVKDFVDVHQPDKDLVDRKTVPRMPWHDCHCRLEGQPARDVARHFIQRWNYSVSTRSKTSTLHHLVPMKGCQRVVIKAATRSREATKRLQRTVKAVRAVQGLRKESLLASSQEDRHLSYSSSPNLSPTWLPPAVQEKGKHIADSKPKRDLGHAASRGFNLNRRLSRNLGEEEKSNNQDTEYDEDEGAAALAHEQRGYAASVQVVRSISLWSGGCPTERSIQNAYVRLITSASHFIYIENQFFVSGLDGDSLCTNRIANALLERIRRAATNKEKFRVMVVLPLLPAFQGRVDDKDASSLRGVMHWQYRSICRGGDSIYHQLFKELEDPFEYLAFYGLRTHAFNDGRPETEQVYVHSKVLIVDDRSAIIGSANINERSMNGDRDSEIAVVVDDTEMDDTAKLAGGTFRVGKFAHSFRMKLFEEHFGITPGTHQYAQYADPVQSGAWFAMQEHAMKNCQIYESVFACLPSDNVVSFKQINLYLNNHPASARVMPASGIAVRSSHHRSRADSAVPPLSSPSSLRMASIAAPATTKIIVEQDDPIDDDEIQIDADQESRRPKADGSDVGSALSSFDQVATADAQSGKRSRAANLSPSRMLSGAIHLNLREDAQILKRKEELTEVQGHIVYFPLKFLADEPLEPKLLPADLFQ